jgi:hypothetical protein
VRPFTTAHVSGDTCAGAGGGAGVDRQAVARQAAASTAAHAG